MLPTPLPGDRCHGEGREATSGMVESTNTDSHVDEGDKRPAAQTRVVDSSKDSGGGVEAGPRQGYERNAPFGSMNATQVNDAVSGEQMSDTRDIDAHVSSYAPLQAGEESDASLSCDNASVGAGGSNKWEAMLVRLKAFKDKHGHCLVPNRFSEDPQLGSWVTTQRRQYKILMSNSGEATSMTIERAKTLTDIGFKWKTKDPRHVPWESRYNELVEFVNQYGHSQVPIGWEQNMQLSNWVSTQRQELKLLQKGRSSRLTDDRIDLLNRVNFVWEAQRGGPRRKRKATVSVPAKANPVEGVGPVNRPSLQQFNATQLPIMPGTALMAAQYYGAHPQALNAGFKPQGQGDLHRHIGVGSNLSLPSPWQRLHFGAMQQTGQQGPIFPIAHPHQFYGGWSGLNRVQAWNQQDPNQQANQFWQQQDTQLASFLRQQQQHRERQFFGGTETKDSSPGRQGSVSDDYHDTSTALRRSDSAWPSRAGRDFLE